jgi:hypothetical protein
MSTAAVSNQPDSKIDKPADAASTSDRPIWLPEKFKSPEEMAKSYFELEKKFGSTPPKQEDKPADKAPDGVQEAPKADAVAEKEALPSDKAAETVQQKIAAIEAQAVQSHLDIDKYKAEFVKDGKLSDESMAELTKVFKPEQIPGFIEMYSNQAKLEASVTEIEYLSHLNISKAELTDLVQWTVNMSDEDRAAYTALVESKDKNQVKLGLKFAKLQRESVEGKAPRLTQGRAAPMESGYNSAAEMRQDIADKRYQDGDPAFHALVDAKLARSNRAEWKDR